MKKTFLLPVFAVLCFLAGGAAETLGGIEPSPFVPVRSDLTLFQQKIDVAHQKLAAARQGDDLAVALLSSRQDLMNLQRSLKAKVKALQETQGQKGEVREVLAAMKPRLDSIDQSLRNLNVALKRGDKIAAGGFLTEMGQTVKALVTLTGK